MISLPKVEDAIRKAKDEYEANLTILALQIRKDILLPFCEKWKVDFIAGQGNLFYSKNGIAITNPWDYQNLINDDQFGNELIDLNSILSVETEYNQFIGAYIEEVKL